MLISGLEKKVLALKFYVIMYLCICNGIFYPHKNNIVIFFVIDNDRMRMWTLMNAFGKKGDKGTLLYQRKIRRNA